MEKIFTKKFSYKDFLIFIAPAVISMIFISLYTIIDGIFVSVLVGSDALASINIVLPIINLIFGISIMLSTGGSAIVSIFLGEKKIKEANNSFSMIFLFALILSIPLAIVCLIFIKEILLALGATDVLLPYCIKYGRIIVLFMPIFILKSMFEFFIRTDGDFKFSLIISVIGGLINIVLDYIFIAIFNWGIEGAALATALGVLISTLMGVWYFKSSKSTLKFVKTKFDWLLIKETMINGSSEMVTELSTGFTTIIFNILALKYAGENGVAALTIILYAHFLLVSTYLGFSSGIAPLISYNYGCNNIKKLKETLKHSRMFLLTSSILIFFISIIFSKYIVGIFVDSGSPVFTLALSGLKIFSVAFLFVGINIFASGLFTSLANGKISAIISFARTFLFVIIGSLILPYLFKLDGVWLILPFAEIMTVFLSFYYIKKDKNLDL